jgi:hypothetical protein
MGFVWLEFPETGGKQRFSEESAEVWRARGWVDCDPPVEPDPTKEPGSVADVAQVPADTDAPQPTETPGADVSPKKTTKPRAKAATSDAPVEK